MGTRPGGKLQHFYGPDVSKLKASGKKSIEWDLNDWKWDGDFFTAAPLNPVQSHCSSRQLFPVGSDIPLQNGAPNGSSSGPSDEAMLVEKRDLEKRRRGVEINDEEVNEEEDGSFNLKLGGKVFPVLEREDKWGKKTKVCDSPSSRAVCQVEDCKADLSNAKDYHRRHKVCDVHSKATSALVGNVMQRFCQQCSRFHVLQEFDEGKRSCRRRLAGHNKRRRKTHVENTVSAASLNDEQGSNNLLIGFLRILSHLHSSSSSGRTKDQDLLSHLLGNLASHAGSTIERNPEGSLPVSQNLQNVRTAVKDPTRPDVSIPSSLTDNAQDGVTKHASASEQSALLFSRNGSNLIKANASDTTLGRAKMNTIDLNDVYDGSQDCMEDLHDNVAQENHGNVSSDPLSLSKELRGFSRPHNDGNSGSSPSHSPSTSSGEAQSRTDRIVFKLFGKDPSDFPIVLRKQILDWLSISPTDIESYIRPGCVVLTIYVCMDKNNWQELYFNLNSSLRRLVDSSNDLFWRTGWIYTRVWHRDTFLYNGQVVLNMALPLNSNQSCKISSITPIAVSLSQAVHFVVKGFNISRSTSRLLCALEGKYLVQENCADVIGEADSFIEHEEIQCISFSCVVPNFVGRGFIEVEDHGLPSSFFPFIVAEKDVCSEIRNLESTIELTDGDTRKIEAKDQALDFVHEMGWLFHRSHLMFRLGTKSNDVEPFPLKRFRWLIEFAIDHDWCAVLNKLLSVLFDGSVSAGQYTSTLGALSDIGILHQAVRKKSRSLVNFLLEYLPGGVLDKTGPQWEQLDEGRYLFRPDSTGPGGLTPLHVAASMDGCENVLDALTEDPGSVGIEAWKKARDGMGFTPYDYASLRGHYSYIHLVHKKANKKKSGNEQVVVDIPGTLSDSSIKQKTIANYGASKFEKLAALETEKRYCQICDEKLSYGKWCRSRVSVMIYRPAMLSMVAIAAVCVCAALLFKSSPEVLYSLKPFRWEFLKYGSQ